MAYGTVKVDTVTFTYASGDTSTTFSGLHASTTNNLTLSGTASANTFTGTTANFTNTNAQNISVTTLLSGLAITGETAGFTTVTGTTVTGTTANFVTVSGTTVTGNTGQFTNLAGAAAGFTTVTGTTVTGTTASFTSGVFASLSGTTHTITSGIFALGTAALPSISFVSDPNTGIYSPGADQLAVATNGVGRLFVQADGDVSIGQSTGNSQFLVKGSTSLRTVSQFIAFDTGTTTMSVWERSDGAVSSRLIYDGTNELIKFGTSTAHALTLDTSDTERARIRSDGTFEIKGAGTAGVSPGFNVNPSTPANSFVIDSSGNIGVGTASPSTFGKLTVLDGSINIVSNTISKRLSFWSTNNTNSENAYIQSQNDGATTNTGEIIFATKNTATSLAERVRITAEGRLGIGTSLPRVNVHIFGTASNAPTLGVASGSLIVGPGDRDYGLAMGTASAGYSWIQSQNFISPGGSAYSLLLQPAGGSVLVGTSNSVQVYQGATTFNSELQVAGSSASLTIARTVGSGNLFLARNQTVNDGSPLGVISFNGGDGTNLRQAAEISAVVDGTPGTGDMPGRLVFSTTADGAASPTERMRITSDGFFKASNNATYFGSTATYHEFNNSLNATSLIANNTNASFSTQGSAGGVFSVVASRSGSSAYSLLCTFSDAANDVEHNLRGDGQAYADGSWNGGGADYAEYFEWSDSNQNAEDRRGISVVLDGDKIREAVTGEDPIGVISGNPSVVGDSAWNKWSGKYLRDEFSTYIQEDHEVEDKDGNIVIQQRRKLNPAYDPDVKYVSREERPEWDCVGLMGKLRIRKGQITGSRWIKMRDINDSVEEWLVR